MDPLLRQQIEAKCVSNSTLPNLQEKGGWMPFIALRCNKKMLKIVYNDRFCVKCVNQNFRSLAQT